MKTRNCFVTIWLALEAASSGSAATHYVDLNSPNPTPPYTNWVTAATIIQDAVDAAAPGDEVMVTNGIYVVTMTNAAPTPGVMVNKPLNLRSVNGPQSTMIVCGAHIDPDEILCVYLAKGAELCGFTVSNGLSGVQCEALSCVISNCVISGNLGGGVVGGTLNNCTLIGNWGGNGGGASYSTLNNCTLIGNVAYGEDVGGGGAYSCTLNDCTLNGNTTLSYFDGFGGGAYFCTPNDCTLTNNEVGDSWGAYSGYGGGAACCTLNNCVLAGNSAFGENVGCCGLYGGDGGGTYKSVLSNCTITGNWAANSGGGAAISILNDCSLNNNSAHYYYGYGGGAAGGTLNNCTLSDNSAITGGGAAGCILSNCTLIKNLAVWGGGASGYSYYAQTGDWTNQTCILNNCIVYFSTSADGANYDSNTLLNCCCTTPIPTNGFGNITNAPLLVDMTSGNLHLQSNSPCINAGNNAYAPAGSDLDGNPRIVGGTVDIGAYEFQTPGSSISYAWLQQYGLPTDGSADFTDPDGDGLNNWQEWRCRTNPTNALSALRLLSPTLTKTNVRITWQSVAGLSYFIERSANLVGPLSFSPLATNITGQTNTTTYTDTIAAGAGPFFYRVGVAN